VPGSRWSRRGAGLLLGTVRGASFRRVRTLWSAELVSVVALIISGLVVARALGPASYGRFALLSAFGAIVYTFLEPRAGEVVTKYFGAAVAEGRRRHARAVLRGMLVLDALAVVVAVVVATALQPWLGEIAPGTALDAALAAAAAGLSGPVLTGRATLAALDEYGAFARIQTGASIVRACGVGGAAVLTRDVTAVLSVLVVVGAAEVAVNLLVVRRQVNKALPRGEGEPRTRVAELRGAAPGVGRFLVYSEASTVLGATTKYADTLIVGAVAGVEQAGLYRLARSLTAPVANVVLPLQTVAYNRFVAVHLQGGAARLRVAARRATVMALPLVLALSAAAALVPWVVRLLAGEEFAGAGPVALVLLLGSAVGLPFYWLRPAYLVLDRLRSWLWVSAATGVLSTIGFLLGAQLEGALGVATARALLVTLTANLVLLVLLKVLPEPGAPKPASRR
jgi:O-antigen/teichoic acid export membrane protein